MSRILGLQYGGTNEGDARNYRLREGFTTPDGTLLPVSNPQQRGTKMQANSTRYGGDHKGLMSFRDGYQLNRDLLDKMASQQYAGDNTEGILKLAVLDRKDTLVKITSLNGVARHSAPMKRGLPDW